MTRTGAGRAASVIVVVAAVVVVVFGVVLVVGGLGATEPRDRLPDLDQEAPTKLGVRRAVLDGRTIYVLGFRSAVRNIGDGPLIIHGDRSDTRGQTMTVDQIINRADATPRLVEGVGTIRYTVSPDHQHWHYLKFDRYELRRATTGEPVVERKSGFCLGDRYDIPRTLPAAPPEPVYTSRCGLSQPDALEMREGISVGYGDDYAAYLEGQDLPLSDLRDGRYVLVHRANANQRLEELSYANNAASLLLDLRWNRGAPQVRILATCPDTDRCTASASDQED